MQQEPVTSWLNSHQEVIVMRGCTVSGALDDTLYAEPLIWIGLYVAAASFLCAAAMAFDAYSGFRHRMPWFPARLFSLNATTITLLVVANKFPVDLNTSMPHSIDQLTKLSGTTLICTAMANFVASLGMDRNDASNVLAVGVLVVTVIVNVYIQMGTGVIYAFLPEHVIMMILMIAQLVILISSALSVKSTRQLLERQYDDLCRQAYSQSAEDGFSRSNLESYIKRAWLMAQTYRPQYGVSEMGSASAALCLVAAIVLTEAVLRAFKSSISAFCSGTSDYGWSTTLVLIVQAAAVVIGTVAPVCRWLYRIHFDKNRDAFKVQEYWVKRFKGWKTPPSPVPLMMGWGWKIADRLKNSVVDGLIRLQSGVVLSCKFIHLAPTCLNKGVLFEAPSLPRVDWEWDWRKVMEESESKDMEEKWRRRSRKDRSLVELITGRSTEGFKDVLAFYGAEPSAQPLNCWALPLVTLVSIAVALPGINQDSVGSLLRGVKQGLKYVSLVDWNLGKADLFTMTQETEVAHMVWSDLNNCKWFDLDWHGSVLGGRERIVAMKDDADRDSEPIKDRASKCMSRACAIILQDYQTDEELFERLRRAISDILGACLTYLQPAIRVQCFYSTEDRETSARNAVSLFGEVKDILDSIEDARKKNLFPDARTGGSDQHRTLSHITPPSCQNITRNQMRISLK